jgi:Bacterial regulatory protein, Fis family
MELADIASLLLDASSPLDASRRVLSYLVEHNEARSVALWRVTEGEEPVLEMGMGVSQETIVSTRSAWSRDSATLLAGQTVIEEDRALIPTKVPGALVSLDGIDPKRLDAATVADAAAVALKALHRDEFNSRSHGLLSMHGLRREELIATLRLHEWNIARVARVKGVTRKTIYEWLTRYNIPRERIPKT